MLGAPGQAPPTDAAPARGSRRLFPLPALVAAASVALAVLGALVGPVESGHRRAIPDAPPPAGGYLPLRAIGSYASLPDDRAAAALVHPSSWEPRPENERYNQTVPTHFALVGKKSADRAYDPRWNQYVLGPITGNFSGTTDEILQWAAAKWGLPDNVLRAVAMMESTWRQSNAGDEVNDASQCPQPGMSLPCPVTFGIVGVRSSSWPGIYPWNRDSTAAAADVLGGWLRGCYEGWVWWLADHGNRSAGAYRAGDLWGCVGAWYSGNWHDAEAGAHSAETYIESAQKWEATAPWLNPGF